MAALNLYGLPPGVRFADALATGLIERHGSADPCALARCEVLVNAGRTGRELREALTARGVRLLPKIRLIEDLARDTPMRGLAPAVPPLHRRLEVARLVADLLERTDLAPRAALFDLAKALSDLVEQMHDEGVSPDALDDLVTGDLARHWRVSLEFVRIVRRYFDASGEPGLQQRLRAVAEALAERLAAPDALRHPTILAGSTGSRGASAILMRALVRHPKGAVVWPGFDFDLPQGVWSDMDDPLRDEDHPQFRYAALMRAMGARRGDVQAWTDVGAPVPARAALLSLALRPAPVTHQWRVEGPRLPPLADATARMTLIEAPSPRMEALTIALRLRRAAEDGQRAALITPDRALGRQVTAALARWGIAPDDSAGVPLHLTAPGRLLRQVARLRAGRADVESILALLKHPLVHTGEGRGAHLRLARRLELELRRAGPPHPDRGGLARWAERAADLPGVAPWARWLGEVLADSDRGAEALGRHVEAHLDLARRLVAGHRSADHAELWAKEAGEAARAAMEALAAAADHAAPMDALDYAQLIETHLAEVEVRRSEIVSDRVLIRGTQEARGGDFDLAILGGLNEGIWPAAPEADPWMSRAMRHACGLFVPERRVGLSAHDFQSAAGAPEVWLSRAVRDAEAPTVPSRWLARLSNLTGGLEAQGGPDAWAEMAARGRRWLSLAALFDAPATRTARVHRPAPAPPADARPTRYSPSSLRALRRDPYAVYARKVLGLAPLDPIRPEATPMLRGEAMHAAFERFALEGPSDDPAADARRFLAIAEAELGARVDWPAEARLWLGQAGRYADWLVTTEAARRGLGSPIPSSEGLERTGEMTLPAVRPVTLTGKADRIDRTPDGRLVIYDWKTGAAPTEDEQKVYDRQLLIYAMMAEAGAFEGVTGEVAAALFVSTGRQAEVAAPLADVPPKTVRAELIALLNRYFDDAQGFVARAAMHSDAQDSPYDHLSRRGEWDVTEPPVTIPVGRP